MQENKDALIKDLHAEIQAHVAEKNELRQKLAEAERYAVACMYGVSEKWEAAFDAQRKRAEAAEELLMRYGISPGSGRGQ